MGLARSGLTCAALGVADISLLRHKELLVQASAMHGTAVVLTESGTAGVVDAAFAPHLVSFHFTAPYLEQSVASLA